MDDELEVCPFCDTSAHKLMFFSNKIYYCKECNRFFTIETKKPKCQKCNSANVVHSDFPMPDGQAVFHCNSCKKNFSAKDLFESNNL